MTSWPIFHGPLTSDFGQIIKVKIFVQGRILSSTSSVESPWTQWTLSSWSIGTRVHGHCPLSLWTMSTESMDIVHWIHGQVHSVHGQCPLSPWTVSTESMDNVHSVHGLFPWVFPSLYLVKNYSNPINLNAHIQLTMHVICISWQTMPIHVCHSVLIDILSLGLLPNRQIP